MKKLKSFKKFGKENVLPRDLETIELKRTVKER